MKVILLNHYERLSPRVALEAETLKQEGYDVTVVKWCRDSGKLSVLEQQENGLPVRWVTLNSSKGSLKILFALPRLYKKMRDLLEKEELDIIHCSHLFLLPIAIFIARKKKAKVIYDAYERYAADIADGYFPFFKDVIRKVIEMGENVFVKRVSGVLTISSANEVLKKRYQKFCENVEVLYNVPLPSTPIINESEIEKLRDMYKGRYIVTYVGELAEDRGLFTFVEVLDLVGKEFPNTLLLLIGEFSYQTDRNKFLKQIMEKGIEAYVHMLPWLPYNKMFQYLKISHVGLAPYKQEWRFRWVGKGTSRKIFTYMQAGLPIVAPNFWEIAKVVEEEKCGLLVDTTDSKEIANAILYLLKHPEEAKRMGENGRKAIIEKYNWENESKKLLLVYKRISGDNL